MNLKPTFKGDKVWYVDIIPEILSNPFYKLLKQISKDKVGNYRLDINMAYGKDHLDQDAFIFRLGTEQFVSFHDLPRKDIKFGDGDRLMGHVAAEIMMRGLFMIDSTKYKRMLNERLKDLL